MTLIKDAERAEDIADALSKFRSSLADQREELVAVIAELNGLSAAIRRIDDLTKSEYVQNRTLVQRDLDIVFESIDFTLEDVWAQLGTIGNGAQSLTVRDYRATWKDICRAVAQSGRRSLTERLQLYKVFLDELGRIMRRRPVSPRQVEDLRLDVKDLLAAQDRRVIALDNAVEDLTLTPVQKRSYEREREPSSPTNSRDNGVPPSVTSPPLSPAPLSPVTTFSSTYSTTSQSQTSGSVIEMVGEHWVKDLFRELSVTPLDLSEEYVVYQLTESLADYDQSRAECYGDTMPDAIAWLNHEKFEKVLQIGFGSGLFVYLFVRAADHRARILCETPERSGHCWYSCMPFNRIMLRRSRSVVRLYCRSSGTDEFHAWANLPFTSMERLVLFYNTCLALRSNDTHKPIIGIRDHELAGEMCPFAGQIKDDGYRHALRVYRDHYSKAVRLQASIYEGGLRNTPIWTAFITECFLLRDWMRLEGRRTVCLRSLRRHVFSSRYDPLLHESGEHVLTFIEPRDAYDFIATITELANAHRNA